MMEGNPPLPLNHCSAEAEAWFNPCPLRAGDACIYIEEGDRSGALEAMRVDQYVSFFPGSFELDEVIVPARQKSQLLCQGCKMLVPALDIDDASTPVSPDPNSE